MKRITRAGLDLLDDGCIVLTYSPQEWYQYVGVTPLGEAEKAAVQGSRIYAVRTENTLDVTEEEAYNLISKDSILLVDKWSDVGSKIVSKIVTKADLDFDLMSRDHLCIQSLGVDNA